MKASPFQVGEITVQETPDFLVREEYGAATIERFGRAQIRAEGLENSTTARPFPCLTQLIPGGAVIKETRRRPGRLSCINPPLCNMFRAARCSSHLS